MIKIQLNPNDRMIGQFAWVAPIGFAAFAYLFHKLGMPMPGVWITLALGPLVLVCHLAGVRVVPLNVFRGLVLLTAPIGFVLFPLLIGLIYYGVFTPMGLFMRMTGRDVLGKKLDPSLPSYWHERGAPRPASSYFKLY
ncbi:MAG: hypothetical protein AB7O97_11870 [Planctomycetota bacterium]